MRNTNKYKVDIVDFFFLIWGIYSIHWVVPGYYPLIDRVSNIFLALGLGISIYYFFYVHGHYARPQMIKVIDVLLLVFVVYAIFSFANSDIFVHGVVKINKGSYLIAVFRSFLPIYAFFAFERMNKLPVVKIKVWTLVQLLLVTWFYLLISTSKSAAYEDTNFTINIGYSVVAVMPLLLFFYKKPIWQYILMGFLFILTVSCVKRGAIIIALLFSVMTISANLKGRSSRTKSLTLLVVTLFAVGIVSYISYSYSNNVYFQSRYEATLAGDSSGRDVIYLEYLRYVFQETSLIQKLFGSGADATLRIYGNYAHNDWVEILFNQGVVGFFLYAAFIVSFYRAWRRCKISNDRLLMGEVFVMYFFQTLFSMAYSSVAIGSAMVIGYVLANSQMVENNEVA